MRLGLRKGHAVNCAAGRRALESRCSFQEHANKSLVVESLLALLGSNVAVVDRADSRRGRALVQVLHELVQRALLALSLASDLWIKRINLCGSLSINKGIG
jgi:RNase P/RNase MRP subunit POP5